VLSGTQTLSFWVSAIRLPRIPFPGVTLGTMFTPEDTHRVVRTYAALTEGLGPPTFEQEFSTFLLALDMNGQGRFATWVCDMVTLAQMARGDGYAQGWLDRFTAPVLGMHQGSSSRPE
jgi:hypothetical protein